MKAGQVAASLASHPDSPAQPCFNPNFRPSRFLQHSPPHKRPLGRIVPSYLTLNAHQPAISRLFTPIPARPRPSPPIPAHSRPHQPRQPRGFQAFMFHDPQNPQFHTQKPISPTISPIHTHIQTNLTTSHNPPQLNPLQFTQYLGQIHFSFQYP